MCGFILWILDTRPHHVRGKNFDNVLRKEFYYSAAYSYWFTLHSEWWLDCKNKAEAATGRRPSRKQVHGEIGQHMWLRLA